MTVIIYGRPTLSTALGQLREQCVQSSCSSLEGRNCDCHFIDGETVQRGEATFSQVTQQTGEAEGLAPVPGPALSLNRKEDDHDSHFIYDQKLRSMHFVCVSNKV